MRPWGLVTGLSEMWDLSDRTQIVGLSLWEKRGFVYWPWETQVFGTRGTGTDGWTFTRLLRMRGRPFSPLLTLLQPNSSCCGASWIFWKCISKQSTFNYVYIQRGVCDKYELGGWWWIAVSAMPWSNQLATNAKELFGWSLVKLSLIQTHREHRSGWVGGARQHCRLYLWRYDRFCQSVKIYFSIPYTIQLLN